MRSRKPDWATDHVEIDPEFLRPAEVYHLLGDYAKARRKLGWEPVGFADLVGMMVESDLDLVSRPLPGQHRLQRVKLTGSTLPGLQPSVARILITGGTGFVGTHLVPFLQSSTSHIAVLASGGKSKTQPGVTYYEVDIRERDAVRSIVQEVKPEQIYHLAGISSVDDSWSNPRLTYEVNVVGAYNLFDAAMSLPSPPRIPIGRLR